MQTKAGRRGNLVMKRFLLVFLLVISGSLVFSVYEIPNPTTSTPRELSHIAASMTYVAYPNPDYNDYSSWKETCFTLFLTEEYLMAISHVEAERVFYTEEERIALLESQLDAGKDFWVILVYLRSDKYPKRNYIQIGTPDSEITRVLMMNDDGDRVLPLMEDSSYPEMDANGNYTSGNTVFFPKYTSDGKPIIHKNSKWIQFWLFTSSERICFQYDFYLQE